MVIMILVAKESVEVNQIVYALSGLLIGHYYTCFQYFFVAIFLYARVRALD